MKVRCKGCGSLSVGDGAAPSFFSVKDAASAEITIKRSRFIGHVLPVADGAEAEEAIGRLRIQYPDASHICYAYRVGVPTTTSKVSDAGEPKGTAGRPILEVLERRGIEQALLAVVRYFGGTLLGAAGLTRAYAQAAAAACDVAEIAEYVPHASVTVELSYPGWAKVEHLFPVWGDIVDLAYGERVRIQCAVRTDRLAQLQQGLADATGGEASVTVGDVAYRPLSP